MSATLPRPDPVRREISHAWARLGRLLTRRYREPMLDGLTPQLSVRVLLADGSEAIWRRDEPLKPTTESLGGTDRLTAIEYPEDRVLRRQFTLPDMTASEVAHAASLDAVTSSPFRSDDLAWGHRCERLPSGQLRVDVVLASRKQIQLHLEDLEVRLAGPKDPQLWIEVWAWADDSVPVVIQGYGENRRARRQARQRWQLGGLLCLAWALLMGIAITPTAQLRLQAIAAVQSFDALQRETAALVIQRSSLSKAADQLVALNEIQSEGVRAVEIVDLLTRALPDDTSLLNLQIQGLKVRLSGQTPNTADLMQTLSGYPGLRDVKAPAAATRPLGASKESFSIELELAPEAFRTAIGSHAASAAVAANAGAASASAQKASAP